MAVAHPDDERIVRAIDGDEVRDAVPGEVGDLDVSGSVRRGIWRVERALIPEGTRRSRQQDGHRPLVGGRGDEVEIAVGIEIAGRDVRDRDVTGNGPVTAEGPVTGAPLDGDPRMDDAPRDEIGVAVEIEVPGGQHGGRVVRRD